MVLALGDVRRTHIKLDFELPNKEYDLDNLVTQLRLGNPSSINPLIEAYMYLAIAIASEYATIAPHCDVLSQALFILTKKVNGCLGPDSRLIDNNIVTYLAKSLRFGLQQFVDKDTLIPKSTHAFRRGYQKINVTGIDNDDIAITNGKVDVFTNNPTEQEILSLRLEGHSWGDIQNWLGLSHKELVKRRHSLRMRYVETK